MKEQIKGFSDADIKAVAEYIASQAKKPKTVQPQQSMSGSMNSDKTGGGEQSMPGDMAHKKEKHSECRNDRQGHSDISKFTQVIRGNLD
ncbi:hypothetical protein [Nitratifractor sp.]|uniref:c-type cytochrome n=1 Tax=Nitratifractor sp. TaxID=2268144 RepID=UPI0025F6E61E|nr:hypothetical protein [Nitratifractor sp.]